MKSRGQSCRLFLLLFVLVLLLSGCGRGKPVAEPSAQPSTEEILETQEKSQTTILLASLVPFEEAADGAFARNGWQADLLVLLRLEESQAALSVVQLDPQTQTVFRLPDGKQTQLPLGQVFSFGSGGSDSCLQLSKTVGDYTGWGPVDHYMILLPEAMGPLFALTGSSQVELDQGTETVDAESAEALLAACQNGGERMAIQRALLQGLYRTLPREEELESLASEMMLALGQTMQTDLTLSQLLALLEQTGDMTLPGDIPVYE